MKTAMKANRGGKVKFESVGVLHGLRRAPKLASGWVEFFGAVVMRTTWLLAAAGVVALVVNVAAGR